MEDTQTEPTDMTRVIARLMLTLLRSALLSVVCIAAMGEVAAQAQGGAPSEYEVKAVFLYNFAKFVEWPSGAFSEGSPFIIGVLGNDPFGDNLDKTVKSKSIDGRKIAVRHIDRVENAKSCHILFVSRSEKGRLNKIMDQLEKSSTLTVGDTDGFLQRGGMINFFIESKKVRFEINPNAAERAKLRISSKLLSLARVVRR